MREPFTYQIYTTTAKDRMLISGLEMAPNHPNTVSKFLTKLEGKNITTGRLPICIIKNRANEKKKKPERERQ